MPLDLQNIQGLSTEEVLASREKYGSNELNYKKTNRLLDSILSLFKEPMVLLLFAASSVYFISGFYGDGIFLASAIILVATISLYQDSRSRSALDKLKDLTQPQCKVIRNGQTESIHSNDVVKGDLLLVEEGTSVVADGTLLHANDLTVDESILTGESFAVSKQIGEEDAMLFRGTTIAGGMGVAKVTAIGNATTLGKIGKSLESIVEEKTPLEIQIGRFVKKMVAVGAIVFVIVWAINFWQSKDLLDSLLKSLTLAMSILPEEIPVAFSTFMALGAWRMMKMGVIVKQMKTVETLGSATTICVDKTGTITENKMSLARIYCPKSDSIEQADNPVSAEALRIVTMAMWASEPIPFDAMEIALHEAYKKSAPEDERPNFKMVHEYPLSGKPPMMTHVFRNQSGMHIIAVKGAPEAILNVSTLTTSEKESIASKVVELASKGYRLLGVGESHLEGEMYPATQQEITFEFKGLVAFYDPPKANISQVLQRFYQAGIEVKIITGDNVNTTTAIAQQIGFKGLENSLTGDELMMLSDEELRSAVPRTSIFTRMFPEAKLRIIEALKSNGEIVAMTGDGVNDGPALKSAHIGIAMGKKGTEIARQASSLILLEDDLSKMVDAIAMGRKIYSNLKNAIRYIISIHIPIILTVFIPLALGWIFPNIFSPVHVIILELIMGPTCSIIFENEPVEEKAMFRKPRPFNATFFNWHELNASLIQGLFITIGTLTMYQLAVHEGHGESLTRTMVFMTLISSNIFLTLVNRSFHDSLFTSLKHKNNLMPLIIGITLVLAAVMLLVPPITRFFRFERLTLTQIGLSAAIGFVSVIWYELVKWRRRRTASTAILPS